MMTTRMELFRHEIMASEKRHRAKEESLRRELEETLDAKRLLAARIPKLENEATLMQAALENAKDATALVGQTIAQNTQEHVSLQHSTEYQMRRMAQTGHEQLTRLTTVLAELHMVVKHLCLEAPEHEIHRSVEQLSPQKLMVGPTPGMMDPGSMGDWLDLSWQHLGQQLDQLLHLAKEVVPRAEKLAIPKINITHLDNAYGALAKAAEASRVTVVRPVTADTGDPTYELSALLEALPAVGLAVVERVELMERARQEVVAELAAAQEQKRICEAALQAERGEVAGHERRRDQHVSRHEEIQRDMERAAGEHATAVERMAGETMMGLAAANSAAAETESNLERLLSTAKQEEREWLDRCKKHQVGTRNSGMRAIVMLFKRWKGSSCVRCVLNWVRKCGDHRTTEHHVARVELETKFKTGEVTHRHAVEDMDRAKALLTEDVERLEQEKQRLLEKSKSELSETALERHNELVKKKAEHLTEVASLKAQLAELEGQVAEGRMSLMAVQGEKLTHEKENEYLFKANTRLEKDRTALDEEKAMLYHEKTHLEKMGIEQTYVIERLERSIADISEANKVKFDSMVDASRKVNDQLEKLQLAERSAQSKAASEFDQALQASQDQVQLASRRFETQEISLRAEVAVREAELSNTKKQLQEALERGDKLQGELNKGVATDRDVVLAQVEAVHAKYREEYSAHQAMIGSLRQENSKLAGATREEVDNVRRQCEQRNEMAQEKLQAVIDKAKDEAAANAGALRELKAETGSFEATLGAAEQKAMSFESEVKRLKQQLQEAENRAQQQVQRQGGVVGAADMSVPFSHHAEQAWKRKVGDQEENLIDTKQRLQQAQAAEIDARECEAEVRALLGESECREQVFESENNNLRSAAQETLEELERADLKISELQVKLKTQKDQSKTAAKEGQRQMKALKDELESEKGSINAAHKEELTALKDENDRLNAYRQETTLLKAALKEKDSELGELQANIVHGGAVAVDRVPADGVIEGGALAEPYLNGRGSADLGLDMSREQHHDAQIRHMHDSHRQDVLSLHNELATAVNTAESLGRQVQALSQEKINIERMRLEELDQLEKRYEEKMRILRGELVSSGIPPADMIVGELIEKIDSTAQLPGDPLSQLRSNISALSKSVHKEATGEGDNASLDSPVVAQRDADRALRLANERADSLSDQVVTLNIVNLEQKRQTANVESQYQELSILLNNALERSQMLGGEVQHLQYENAQLLAQLEEIAVLYDKVHAEGSGAKLKVDELTEEVEAVVMQAKKEAREATKHREELESSLQLAAKRLGEAEDVMETELMELKRQADLDQEAARSLAEEKSKLRRKEQAKLKEMLKRHEMELTEVLGAANKEKQVLKAKLAEATHDAKAATNLAKQLKNENVLFKRQVNDLLEAAERKQAVEKEQLNAQHSSNSAQISGISQENAQLRSQKAQLQAQIQQQALNLAQHDAIVESFKQDAMIANGRADAARGTLADQEARLHAQGMEFGEANIEISGLRKEIMMLQEDKGRLIEEAARLTEVYTTAITSRGPITVVKQQATPNLPPHHMSPRLSPAGVPTSSGMQSSLEKALREMQQGSTAAGAFPSFEQALDALTHLAIGPIGEQQIALLHNSHKALQDGLAKERLAHEHTLQRLLEDVRHVGIDAQIHHGQLMSASIATDHNHHLLAQSVPLVIGILRLLCQSHYLGSRNEAKEAIGMGTRVAESLERPDGLQHYMLGLECVRSVVENFHAALQSTAQENELLAQEKGLLEHQVGQLQSHLHHFASQKDADALERQTRQALDTAQTDLLAMASNGRITDLESAADLVTKYTQMESDMQEAKRAAAQHESAKRDLEQQLALYQREVEICRSGDFLFHKERVVWSEEFEGTNRELQESLRWGSKVLTNVLLMMSSKETQANTHAALSGGRYHSEGSAVEPRTGQSEAEQFDYATTLDAGAGAKQQHVAESESWAAQKAALRRNLDSANRIVMALEQCQKLYAEERQQSDNVMTQMKEQSHVHDLEMAALNGMKDLRPSDSGGHAMHEWLDNIEAEFDWLRQPQGKQ